MFARCLQNACVNGVENNFRNDVYLYENLPWLRHGYGNLLVSVILCKNRNYYALPLDNCL
jgi:hypothetical protein